MNLPDGGVIDYQYDASGDLVRVVDAGGEWTDFTYDAGHRLVSWQGEGAANAAVATYDASVFG